MTRELHARKPGPLPPGETRSRVWWAGRGWAYRVEHTEAQAEAQVLQVAAVLLRNTGH